MTKSMKDVFQLSYADDQNFLGTEEELEKVKERASQGCATFDLQMNEGKKELKQLVRSKYVKILGSYLSMEENVRVRKVPTAQMARNYNHNLRNRKDVHIKNHWSSIREELN